MTKNVVLCGIQIYVSVILSVIITTYVPNSHMTCESCVSLTPSGWQMANITDDTHSATKPYLVAKVAGAFVEITFTLFIDATIKVYQMVKPIAVHLAKEIHTSLEEARGRQRVWVADSSHNK